MKKTVAYIFIFVLILCVSSCDLFKDLFGLKTQGLGGLKADVAYNGESISRGDSRTIRPVLNFELTGFDWYLTGPSGETKEYLSTSTLNDSSLSTGVWSVKVVGKNSAGVILAEGFSEVTIKPVITTSISVEVSLLAGKGDVKLELAWPPGILTSPSIVAYMEKVSTAEDGKLVYGDPIDLEFVLSAGNSGALYQGKEIDSGYYLISIRLLENGETTWGIREALYVIKGEISAKKYELPGASLKTKPLAPSRLVIQNYGKGDDGKSEIELRWQDNSDNESQFVLMRKLKEGTDYVELTSDIAMDQVSYIDKGLDKTKVYEYKIASKNLWGMSELSNSVTSTFPDVVDVTGPIEGEQKWTKEHSYLLPSGLTRIISGARLTIEPGTLVKFSDNAELMVEGTLIADGTAGDFPASIIFSSGKLEASAGSWVGITLSGAGSSNSILKNCIFSDARSIRFEDSYPLIDTISAKNFTGYTTWDSLYGMLNFNYTTGAGIESHPYMVKNLSTDGSSTGIRVVVGTQGSGTIVFENFTIKNATSRGLCVINESDKLSLTFSNGNIFNCSFGAQFLASNSKTSIEDSTLKGNNTGIGIQEWSYKPQNGIIKRSKISNNQDGIQVYISNCPSSCFKIFDNTISDNTVRPIRADTGLNGVMIQGNDILNNREAIYMNGSTSTRLDSNSFHGALYGREIQLFNSVGIDAAYNYWGTSDLASIQSRIWDKRDDASLGEVKIQPYYTKTGQYLKPKYPVGGVMVKDYEFSFKWESYKRPTGVEFKLARDAAMSDIVLLEKGDFGFSYTLPVDIRNSLEAGKQYFWKVGSVNEYGDVAYGELNTFTMSKAGMDINLIQFEEEVGLESLPSTLYLGKTYAAKAVSTKKADSYRWTLGSELLQEGSSEFLEIKPSLLGPGTYLLTVKAYFGLRHTSATKSFTVEQMKVVAAWNIPWATVVRLSDGMYRGWGNGIWINGNATTAQQKLELDYGETVDFQAAQGCYFWLKSDGTLWGAGNNYSGELGIGSTGTQEYQPKKIAQDVKAFSIGSQEMTGVFGLILKNDGSVYSWGDNGSGQLGLGNYTRKTSPTKVTLSTSAVMVSAGHLHSLALLDNGKVMGWGYNETRPLGPVPTGLSNALSKPIEIPGISDIISIHAGCHISFFITSAGKIKVLGRDSYGDSGIGQEWWTYEVPQTVSIGKTVRVVKNMEYATFALTESGELYSWGKSWEGTLGQKESNDYTVTTPKLVAENVKDFGVGRRHAWYIDTSGAFWIWGSNSNWQNGDSELGKIVFFPTIVNW